MESYPHDQLRTLIIDLSITAATTTWITYDYVLTFSDEIKYLWTSHISITTILLFILRYGALFRQVLHMCDFLHLDISSGASSVWCHALALMSSGFDAIVYIATVLFASLRTYAVSTRHGGIKAVLVFVFGMTFAACDAYANAIDEGALMPAQAPFSGCFRSNSLNKSLTSGIVRLVGLCLLVLSELSVQILTWQRSLITKRGFNIDGTRQPLVRILLRDGTLVYLFFVVWFVVCQIFTRFVIADMTVPAISIAVCRIMFRFHRTVHPPAPEQVVNPTYSPSQVLDTTCIRSYLSGTNHNDFIAGEDLDCSSDH